MKQDYRPLVGIAAIIIGAVLLHLFPGPAVIIGLLLFGAAALIGAPIAGRAYGNWLDYWSRHNSNDHD